MSDTNDFVRDGEEIDETEGQAKRERGGQDRPQPQYRRVVQLRAGAPAGGSQPQQYQPSSSASAAPVRDPYAGQSFLPAARSASQAPSASGRPSAYGAVSVGARRFYGVGVTPPVYRSPYGPLPLPADSFGADSSEHSSSSSSSPSPESSPKLPGKASEAYSDVRAPDLPSHIIHSGNDKADNSLAYSESDNIQPSQKKKRRRKKRKRNKSEMVGKKSSKTLQMEEGLERTDNGMKLTSFPEVNPINQKNYYTEYMKRDDQILALRLQTEANRERLIRNAKDKDRALARGEKADLTVADDADLGDEDINSSSAEEIDPSKIIVIHPGSQNLRIGFASDALPRTIPMCFAMKSTRTESDVADPRPRRQNLDTQPDQQFSEEWSKKYTKMSNDLKVDMRANKRKVLPNSKELVVNYNRRTPPEEIPEHNDATRVEWTDVSTVDKDCPYFVGLDAQRIPDDIEPPWYIRWPLRNGWVNERDFLNQQMMRIVFEKFFAVAAKQELGLPSYTNWSEYSVVFVIPDLYDKKYVEEMFEVFMKELEVKSLCFIQESLAATFGAGYSSGCVVDIGAQKTSIACVEDGMIIEDSRINLKYGGFDVTETFIKMMLYDHFPYFEINLARRHDFLLAEELKQQFCTMNQGEISVQLYNFHLRAPNQPTRKYNFKTYDEVILAPMGFCDPSIFDNESKLEGRRWLMDRSYNHYEPDVPDDPVSAAQDEILGTIKPSLNRFHAPTISNGEAVSTPAKEKSQPFFMSRLDSDAVNNGATPGTSAAGSPAPDGTSTPNPSNNLGANGNIGSPAPMLHFGAGGGNTHTAGTPVPNSVPNEPSQRSAKDLAIERDEVLPIYPLDQAILTSIRHAARGDDKKFRDFAGGIMVIGGGAKTTGFGPWLESRLHRLRPDLADRILVGTSPREMDGQVVVWKGASVFAKLSTTNDTWIKPLEYERLNTRILYHKFPWNY